MINSTHLANWPKEVIRYFLDGLSWSIEGIYSVEDSVLDVLVTVLSIEDGFLTSLLCFLNTCFIITAICRLASSVNGTSLSRCAA